MNKPLTDKEVSIASKQFFDLYQIVYDDLRDYHENVKAEEVLKAMEQVCGLAQKLRAQEVLDRFGFNKEQEDADLPSI
jgi:hypothetical protein